MNARPTALRPLLIGQAVLIGGLTLSFPFLTLYLHERRGLPMGLVGLSISAALVATAVGQAVGGELADLWGCKRVMAASLAGRAAATGLMSAAVAGEWPVPAMVALHCCAGFVGNLYDPAVRAWIAHEHPPADRPRAFGLLRVAANAAWAVGPAIGGLLAARSYAGLFAVTAASCAACLVWLWLAVPPAPAARREESFSPLAALSAARDRRFLAFCLLVVALAATMAQLVSPMSAHARVHAGLTEARIGLLFALNGLLVVLLQQKAARAVARGPLTSWLAIGALFYAAAWSWVGFAASWLALAAGMAVVTLGEVLVSPSMHSVAANLAPERERGRYMGFLGLSYQLGHALGPTLGGWGLERASWAPAPWLAAGALAAATSVGFRRLGRRLSPAQDGIFQEAS